MDLKRIDVIETNISDCMVDDSLKLKKTKGTGESRIYINGKENENDEFFEFENIKYFFILKKDLIEYLMEAKIEYMYNSQEYRENISNLYDLKLKKIKEIKENIIKILFEKKFDKGNRYFIVLILKKENRKNYNYIKEICIPRLSKLMFVKLRNSTNNKIYMYIKPILYLDSDKKNLRQNKSFEKIIQHKEKKEYMGKREYREKQTEYRISLLNKMPYCIITNVSDDRILQACHIKPYSKCDDDEKYDIKNGLIMTPTYHKLFDLGFISFKNNGEILISGFLSNLNLNRLNLKNKIKYRLNSGCQKYLKFHREIIFNKLKNEDFKELD